MSVLSLLKISGHFLYTRLVVMTVDPRSYRWLMIWNRRSAPALSFGKFDVADTRFDAALLVAGSHVTRHDLEGELAGEVGVTRVEDRRLAREPPQNGGLEVVEHHLLGHRTAEIL